MDSMQSSLYNCQASSQMSIKFILRRDRKANRLCDIVGIVLLVQWELLGINIHIYFAVFHDNIFYNNEYVLFC